MFRNIYTTRMSGNSRVLKKRFESISAKPVKFKRMLTVICATIILSVLILNTLVMADITNESNGYALDITNNSEVIELENKPFIENGEVYVPLEELFTKLGFMSSPEAEITMNEDEILIKLYETTLNEDAVADYTVFTYKIEIGKNELIINPEILVPRYTPEEATSFVEEMDNTPLLKNGIIYIPFSYAERMVERADIGFYSPRDRYKIEFIYSGETLSIAYPIQGYYEITQSFGKRVHPITGEESIHSGVDFKAEEGTPVLSGIDGKITDSGFDKKNGNYVTISNENGVEITYCHLESSVFWETGIGKQGDVIGYVGNTGKSTGPHLHMEVKINGEYVNPELYFEESRYDELIAEIAKDIPRMLERCGYADADYKIIDIDYAENMALIKVEILNYNNKILSIIYDYAENSPLGWSGYEAPEYWNDVNF